MHDPDDLKKSVKRLTSGETVGMVDAELKRQGLPDGVRVNVLEMAKRTVNRRSRIKYVLLFLVGTLVLLAGSYWFYIDFRNNNFRVQAPVAVMVSGLIAAAYGLYFSFQNRV